MGSKAAQAVKFAWSSPVSSRVRQFFWETADFRRYGLLFHDTVNDSLDYVQEAIRRLPPHEYDGRQFRIMRAANLGMNNEVLPKDQWTKWTDETWYLKPYVDEVKKEISLKQGWTGILTTYQEKYLQDRSGH